jgi:hypothetical protein
MDGYAVIDDFLPAKEWEGIYNAVLGMHPDTNNGTIQWVYVDHKVSTSKNNFQFVHTFFGEDLYSSRARYSNDSYIVEPLMEKINPDSVERIKANLQTKVCKQEIDMEGFHTDQVPDDSGEKYNAVYYVNDNNGFTAFKGGVQVKSKSNRLLVFKNELEHTGTAQSDTNVRVVINFTFNKKGGCLGV